ncbi:MAG: DUF91 domain-containing protein [Nitrospirae bacterium]|nr:DUF91 domain-containing protein [Nitrospirota bacterium]
MPIYTIKNDVATKLNTVEFKSEKELQTLVEKNLHELFGLRIVATEYWTGGSEGGYIDTIALDENNSPVVIEYKWGENVNVINQGLYYIDRLLEHRGDFETKVRTVFDEGIKINWSQPRLILIAKSYNRFDQHAVKRIGGNIELVRYTKLDHNLLNLESVYAGGTSAKKPFVKATGKKAAINNDDPLTERLEWVGQTNPDKLKLYTSLRELILGLDENISEKRFKNGSQFRYENKSFAAISPWKAYARVYVTISGKLDDPHKLARSNKDKGKMFASTHDFQISHPKQLADALDIIKQAYREAV